MPHCPCGSTQSYSDCCGRYISSQEEAPTPEALMRSRYTAYTQSNIDYIMRTMQAPANIDFDAETARKWAERSHWLKLEILNTSIDGMTGTVEFRAHYSLANTRTVLHEISEFHQENGVWYYVDGVTPTPPAKSAKTGRNDPCSCGSGKKYKKCCGK